MIAAAIITAIAFIAIYFVVYLTSFRHLDEDIRIEKEEVFHSLDFSGDSIVLKRMPEWEEAEHQEIEVNPVFLQIINKQGKIVFTSGNLGGKTLEFTSAGHQKETIYNSILDRRRLRQGQFPLINKEGRSIGQLIVAISQQESYTVLKNLLFILCIFFPVILIVQYIIMQLAASRAIAPVQRLIKTASGINESNIGTRLPLPQNEDEIYQLAITINDLLRRLEASITQQKQFIADASHEMRTPLSAIRGMLEVLTRKKRPAEQYEEKIHEVIAQTDRLTQLYDELLHLSRLESGAVSVQKETVDLRQIFLLALDKWKEKLNDKNIHISIDIPANALIKADPFFTESIFDNLISNATKYCQADGKISVQWSADSHTLTFEDNGPGLPSDQIPFLFTRFYRGDPSRSSAIAGSGLGLAIVKKMAELQQIGITAESSEGMGLSIHLTFPDQAG